MLSQRVFKCQNIIVTKAAVSSSKEVKAKEVGLIEIEEKVLKMAAAGDMRSFEEIVIQSQDYIWSYALRFLGDYHLAQDAAQEIFIKIYKGLPNFGSKSKFTTWLYTVTHNCCVDFHRKHCKSKETDEFVDGVVEGDAPEYPDGYLSETLNRLKPELRQVFGMVMIFGFSYKEAAETLGCSIEVIKSRLYRARQELIKMLKISNLKEVAQ
jgi:RNA polymerase sigma-70 factor (ECF subfamily)